MLSANVWARKLPMLCRYLLGLVFFLSGVVGLFNLAPPPENMPENMMTFMNGLNATGYFFKFLKLTETICGLLLILRIAPALMLVILAPISINIFLVHLFMTPGIQNLLVPILIVVLHGLAAVAYWHAYRPLFKRL